MKAQRRKIGSFELGMFKKLTIKKVKGIRIVGGKTILETTEPNTILLYNGVALGTSLEGYKLAPKIIKTRGTARAPSWSVAKTKVELMNPLSSKRIFFTGGKREMIIAATMAYNGGFM